MDEKLLNDSFEMHGKWFYPDKEEEKMYGVLQYSPEVINLQLEKGPSLLNEIVNQDVNKKDYFLYGITDEAQAMTLINPARTGFKMKTGCSGGGIILENLTSQVLVIDGFVNEKTELKEMSFRLPGLSSWFSVRTIKERVSLDSENRFQGCDYKIEPFLIKDMRVGNLNCSLDWFCRYKTKFDLFTGLDISINGWLTIRPDNCQQLEWYFKQLDVITTMLSLISGAPMVPDCINATIGSKTNEASIMATRYARKLSVSTFAESFFMSLLEMGTDLSEVVNRWFTLSPEVEAPSKLAESVLVSGNLWPYVEFLSLMQALEGFHRALFKGNYMSENDYEPIKNDLQNAIRRNLPDVVKESLKNRIKYGYQFSLKQRLDELIGTLPEEVKRKILGREGKIPRSWIDTRNYYTHWDQEEKGRLLKEIELFDAIARMRVFLQVLYLLQMGINEKAIISVLGNASQTSQRLIRANIREKEKSNMK